MIQLSPRAQTHSAIDCYITFYTQLMTFVQAKLLMNVFFCISIDEFLFHHIVEDFFWHIFIMELSPRVLFNSV